jgi:plasmid stability protein
MAQLVLENLDPILIEKLRIRSQQHGRSLDEELKAILAQAFDIEVVCEVIAMAEAREKLEQARARYAGRNFSDSTELVREDRDR